MTTGQQPRGAESGTKATGAGGAQEGVRCWTPAALGVVTGPWRPLCGKLGAAGGGHREEKEARVSGDVPFPVPAPRHRAHSRCSPLAACPLAHPAVEMTSDGSGGGGLQTREVGNKAGARHAGHAHLPSAAGSEPPWLTVTGLLGPFTASHGGPRPCCITASS